MLPLVQREGNKEGTGRIQQGPPGGHRTVCARLVSNPGLPVAKASALCSVDTTGMAFVCGDQGALWSPPLKRE